jgi:hypothetical protein
MTLARIATLAALSLVTCKSAEVREGSSADKTSSGDPASSSSVAASATGAAPAVVGVRAGKLNHPGTKQELKLVETSLAKCFGFKGYSMMAPEGSTAETVIGARACAVFLPTPKKKFGFMVMTDEVKVKWWKRTDLENVKQKHLDEPDAFVFEVDDKGKTKLTGWMEKKIGPRNVQCNSMRDADTMSLDDELAFIEVCRTLKYAEPEKR